MASRQLGVDIGGTFTDFVVVDPNAGTWRVGKRLTSDENPAQAFRDGVREILGEEDLGLESLLKLVHGTTLVTNMIIERRGVPTGLLATEGFRDAIELGRQHRYDVYDLQLENPEPLVKRPWRRDVPERIGANGEVLKELDLARATQEIEFLISEGVESIAVCFLHAYKNPTHEERIRDLIQENYPQISVSISSEVAPEIREYERTSTVIINAYVRPRTQSYLSELKGAVRKDGLTAPFHVMLSSGGITTTDQAGEFPIRIVESGPAAGAIVAKYIGQRAGLRDVIGLDMGGTTSKIALVEDGELASSSEFECARMHRFKKGSGFPVKAPVVELLEIGAGGGSIASVDEMGLMKVGPRSAGASPGPACYGLGGIEPTVTDADLVLGYLDPDYFLGGTMQLDLEAAKRAFDGLGLQLLVDGVRAARGVRQIVDEQMATATQMHIAERGGDPDKFAMVATGGAGPVHAMSVARSLGLGEVVFPIGAGVASALGLLVSPVIAEQMRSMYCTLDNAPWEAIADMLSGLESQARERVSDAGAEQDSIEIVRTSDMRYVGQGHEIRVPLPSGHLGSAESVAEISESFEKVYEQLYGLATPGVPIEILSWRVVASAQPRVSTLRHVATLEQGSGDSIKGERRAFFAEAEGELLVPVYDRYVLRPGDEFAGPAIVEERESTAVIGPASSVRIDDAFNVRVRIHSMQSGSTSSEALMVAVQPIGTEVNHA